MYAIVGKKYARLLIYEDTGSIRITIKPSNMMITEAAENIEVFLKREDRKNDVEIVEKQPHNAWINIIRGSIRKNVDICNMPAPNSKSNP